jgi:hypothetical protein
MTRAIVNGAIIEVPTLRRLRLDPPAEGRVTQAFGVRSVTGILHRGIDLAIPEGTPVRNVAAGTVLTTRTGSWTWRGPLPKDYRGVDTAYGGYGNHVVVDHGGFDDMAGARWLVTSMYAHLSKVLVAPGQRVAGGSELGRSGSTGISTGDHLHWEIRRNADPFEPHDYLYKEDFVDYPVAAGRGTIDLPGSESGKPFNHYFTLKQIGIKDVPPASRVRVVLQLLGGHPGSFASLRDAAGNSLCFTTVQGFFAPSPDAAGEALLDDLGGLKLTGQSLALKRRRLELPPKPLRAVVTVFAQEVAA